MRTRLVPILLGLLTVSAFYLTSAAASTPKRAPQDAVVGDEVVATYQGRPVGFRVESALGRTLTGTVITIDGAPAPAAVITVPRLDVLRITKYAQPSATPSA